MPKHWNISLKELHERVDDVLTSPWHTGSVSTMFPASEHPPRQPLAHEELGSCQTSRISYYSPSVAVDDKGGEALARCAEVFASEQRAGATEYGIRIPPAALVDDEVLPAVNPHPVLNLEETLEALKVRAEVTASEQHAAEAAAEARRHLVVSAHSTPESVTSEHLGSGQTSPAAQQASPLPANTPAEEQECAIFDCTLLANNPHPTATNCFVCSKHFHMADTSSARVHSSFPIQDVTVPGGRGGASRGRSPTWRGDASRGPSLRTRRDKSSPDAEVAASERCSAGAAAAESSGSVAAESVLRKMPSLINQMD